jgi:DNA replication and repair protein RecF
VPADDTAYVAHLSLRDFRCFEALDLDLAPGTTVLVGANGAGKTSLLEAVGWSGRARSFRGVPDAAIVRRGAEQAILRAEVVHGERRQLLEAEVRASGRNSSVSSSSATRCSSRGCAIPTTTRRWWCSTSNW